MYEMESEIIERKGKTLTPACRMLPTFSFCCAFLLYSTFLGCFARDTINVNSTLYEIKGETLVSAGGIFELGFFAPNGSSSNHSYLGIWYRDLQPKTVVWVANRDNPLSDSSGTFAIADDGNLKVLNKSGCPYWSTGLELPKFAYRDVVATLLDSGNLVLRYFNQSESFLWRSFDHPVDTFLPGMTMNDQLSLNSWTSLSDPLQGDFSFKKDDGKKNAFVILKDNIPYWRSGGSDEFDSKVDKIATDMIYCFLYNSSPSQRVYNLSQTCPISNRTYWMVMSNTGEVQLNRTYWRMVMSNTGEVQLWMWDMLSIQWSKKWMAPGDTCGVINVCGNFSICNINNEELCKCLPEFNPIFPEKWNQGDFSGGCSRSMSICGCSKEFKKLKIMKIGKYDSSFSGNSTECRDACLNGCRCQAYSYTPGENSTQRSFSKPTCWIWTNDLNNIQEDDLDSEGGHELFVREANSCIDPRGDGYPKQIEWSSGNNKKVSLIVVTIASVVVFSNSILCLWLWRRKMAIGKARKGIGRKEAIAYHTEKHIKDLIDTEDLTEEDQKRIDVQFFNLHSILTATDNFSEANKLGQGGFGSVYKGTLPEGQEVAIKRLSSVSVQGLEEFKNEVLLIAKLQHRNLVRLLGYCLKGDEKILVYEYMPNKSLDFLIFDSKLCELLNWEMRFNIILGIARGLLYLHQDSRLRIVHRDLKTSNILLDEEMNPKISDFGLARIVEGKMKEGSTNRVVGTFGYMSPEYAIDGLFSVKSDVFSFGVVMLEILSGRKNTAYFNLLAYSWKFWREDKALELLDETLRESCNSREFSKCVNVALLCVQEDPVDRPTMSNVVVYLSSEIDTYPTPKQPAFFTRANLPATSSTSSSKQETIIDLAASSGD